MNKVNIVYYSFTGNTLRMVKAFEKGLQEANVPFKSYSVVELKDDNEALSKDWEIIGNDLKGTIDKYGKEFKTR